MTAPMAGIRVLEVAEHTFVPAAAAVLSDWGADVIKVEHVTRGDAMRGLGRTGSMDLGSDDVHPLMEHSNRGKRSIGLDLSSDDGREMLYRLAEQCDVFITNKLPRVLAALRIDVDDIRARSPRIVYVKGSGFGSRGPDRDAGGYDVLGYWSRSGLAGRCPPGGLRGPGAPAGAGLRRLRRGDHHRRRGERGAAPPRAHRRGPGGRRVVAGRRHVGDGRRHRPLPAPRPALAPGRHDPGCLPEPVWPTATARGTGAGSSSRACRVRSTGRRCAR